MTVGIPGFTFAEPVTNYDQGIQTGQTQQVNALALQNVQQQQSDQNALKSALSQGLTGTPSDQQNALSTLAQQAPMQVPSYTQAISQMNGAQQAALTARATKVFQDLNSLTAIPPGPQREAAYQQTLDQEQANGNDVSNLRGLPANQGIQMAMMHVQSIADALKAAQPQSFDLAPGASRVQYNPITQQQSVLASASAEPKYVDNYNTGKTDANGQPILAQGYVTPQGFQPLGRATSQGGQSMAPAGAAGAGNSGVPGSLPAETQNYVPSVLSKLGGQQPLNPDGTASPALIQAVIGQESGGNPNAVSGAGAQGMMQVMPATGANPGYGIQPAQNNSPAENVRVGTAYLNAMLKNFGGNVPLALAAYNAGPGRVTASLGTQGGMAPGSVGAQSAAAAPVPSQGQVASAAAPAPLPGSSDGGIGVSVGMGGGGAPSPDSGAQPVTAIAGQGSPAQSAATVLEPGEYSQAPKEGKQNVVQERKQTLAQWQSNGIQLTPAQQTQYLLDGKPPVQDGSDGNGPLADPGEESMAQALANYQLPVSARFIQSPANQKLVERALQVNPSLNVPQYMQNQKLIGDMASNSPTSVGGGIVAANTALAHLANLSAISDKLPQSLGAVNAVENTVGNALDTPTGVALRQWNTGVGLAAAELQKMVKSGVATEGETSQMLANLSPNAPPDQRNAALAQLATFMNDKLQQQQSRRDQVLGNNSPGTSFLTAPSQANLASILQKARQPVPDLGAPSQGLGYASQAQQQARAAIPSGAGQPPAAAIQMLRANPGLRAAFDAKYGTGLSAQVLGQ